MDTKEIFRANLKRYMENAGMNQNDLAKAVGKTEGSVSFWISGRVFPRIGTIQKLADIFGCRTDDLLLEHISMKILGYSDEKQTKEMNDYWFRLNSANKKAVLNLMKALAENQEESK